MQRMLLIAAVFCCGLSFAADETKPAATVPDPAKEMVKDVQKKVKE